MKSKWLGILVLSILFFSLASSCCFAVSSDFQYWNSDMISVKLTEDLKFVISQEMYFKDDASDFYYEHTELGLLYSGIYKWFDFGFNFRHTLNESGSMWKREEMPNMVGFIKWSIGKFSFIDRNRLEYRIREDADDRWRYRNYLMVKMPVKFTSLEIQPFVGDEFFVDLDRYDICENRLYSGFSFKISKNVSSEIYYVWRRTEPANKWQTQHVVGTALKLSF